MLFLYTLAGCRINHNEYLDLQDQLRDTANDIEDTSEAFEMSNTKYALFEPNGCIEFEQTKCALNDSSWSFSFRFAKDMVAQGMLYNMFQVDDTRILLYLDTPNSYLLFCDPVEVEGLGTIDDFCTQIDITFQTAPAPYDRITISLSSQGNMLVYHNDGLASEPANVENKFPQTGSLSFGCPARSEQNIFQDSTISWIGGIDSLFLFHQALPADEVQSLYEAESTSNIWEHFNWETVDSYWNLGEDPDNTIIDHIGDNNGTSNPLVVFRDH